MTDKKRKRNDIDLKTKLLIIADVKKGGQSYASIGKKFKLNKSTVSKTYANRHVYESSDTCRNRKRSRLGKFPELESALIEWLKVVRSKSLPINGPVLIEKAKEFAQHLDINDFNASEGWLSNFKTRHGIVFKMVVGEGESVSSEQVLEWVDNVLPALLTEYDEENVFNLGETGLFWRLLPNKTFTFKGDKCDGGKKSKERITLLVGANMNGTEKLPIFAIGKSQKPRCFKDVRTLPVKYTANKKAWMVSKEWESYLRFLDRKYKAENRNVMFIVDNCPAHPQLKGLSNVRVVFLPPNTTAKTQPMDQGIIQNLKVHYRQSLLQRYVRSIDHNKKFEYSLLDSLYDVRKSWDLVTTATIRNCFRKAGFSKSHEPEEVVELIDMDLWENLRSTGLIRENLAFKDFIDIDTDIETAGWPSDEEIIKNVQASFQQRQGSTLEIPSPIPSSASEDESADGDMTVPSTEEACDACQVLRGYVLAAEDGDQALNHVMRLDYYISQHLLKKFWAQSKMTDYFKLK